MHVNIHQQPQEQEALEWDTVFSFSPCGSYFALVTRMVDSFRLRVWETSSKLLLLDYNGESGVQCTCMSWNKHQESSVSENLIMALGLSSGQIHLLSIAEKKVFSVLQSHSSTHPIVDFLFLSNHRGLSASEDGLIADWDLKDMKQKRFLKSDEGLMKVCLNPNETVLAAGGHQIKLYSMTDFSCTKSFIGHPSSISQISFASGGDRVISFSKGERSLSEWKPNSSKKNMSNVFSTDSEIKSFSISRNQDYVLAIDQHGKVLIWDMKGLDTKSKMRKSKLTSIAPTGLLKMIQSDNPEKGIQIHAAYFMDDMILCVRGSSVNPIFEKISFMTADGCIIPEIIVKRSPTDTDFLKGGSGNIKEKNSFDATSLTVKSGNDSIVSDEKPIEEKLRETYLTSRTTTLNSSKITDKENKKNSLNSLHQMLSQAILSDDQELLERCLRVRDSKLITTSIQRLSSTLIPKFLQQILNRLEKKPIQSLQLTEWIRAILIYHATYLISVPSIAEKLGTLYQTLEQRVSTYEKMLKLSGRLDMIICQSQLRHSSMNLKGEMEEEEALVTLEEGDEDMTHFSNDESDFTETESYNTESEGEPVDEEEEDEEDF